MGGRPNAMTERFPAYCFEDARRGFLIYLLIDKTNTVNTTRKVKNS